MKIKGSLPALSIREPELSKVYLGEASKLLQGVKALSVQQDIDPRSCLLLAAHALECSLKAFLAHSGKEKKYLRKVGHKIIKLWRLVYQENVLCIPEEPPGWVEILAKGHESHYFRYQETSEGAIANAGETLELIPMEVELRKLVENVSLELNDKK